MDNVNQTLYIPLYGKAYVSRKGIILHDAKAEQIWASEGFALKGKSGSKWLAYYMAMRAGVFDRWLKAQMEAAPEAVVLHLGCGMDSRVERVGTQGHLWYDVDFPDVICQRMRYYQQSGEYRMIASDIRHSQWLAQVPKNSGAVIVMEGVSMYLRPEERKAVLKQLKEHFGNVWILMDCYTEFAAKASKYKNPINDVGVTQVYGVDDPRSLEAGTGLSFEMEHHMTPEQMIDQLQGIERLIFKTLFAGRFARRMYRLYSYR